MLIRNAELLREKKYLPESRRAIRLRRSRLTEVGQSLDYRIKTATSREEWIEAFSLAHDRYVELGYMDPDPSTMRLKIQNILPSTRVFTARSEGRAVATATLIIDSPLGLPSDAIYKNELDMLRNKGRLVSEGSSLVTAKEFKCSNIFMLLFKVVYAYAQYVQTDDICIAVNPKHARFYEDILLFEPIGELRYFPSVKDAPAILERMDLRTAHARFADVYNMEDFDCDLYTFFFTANNGDESEWGKSYPTGGLRMSLEDIRYFFVEQTDLFVEIDDDKLAYIRKCYPDYDFTQVLPPGYFSAR
ncbi:MAG: hypothetical protein PHT49_08240 [Desulfovibrionales bacterium]|nr:hypothetical protein [Desulfovibrionales bacterium]